MTGWLLCGAAFLTAGVVYIGREWRYIIKTKRLKIVSYFRLMYALSFGLVPSLLCLAYAIAGREYALKNLIIMDYSPETLRCLWLFWLFSVIGYCGFNLGYQAAGERRIVLKWGERRLLESPSFTENQVFWIAMACFLVGWFSLYMWTIDLGGIFEFIPLASGIRGDYLNTYGNTHQAWRQPARICLPASYLFFFLALSKNSRHRWRNLFMTLASGFVAVLYLICNDGRQMIAFYLLVLVISMFTHGSIRLKAPKKTFFKLGVTAACGAVLLAKLDDITYFFRHWTFRPTSSIEGRGIIGSLMEEFLFVYKSGIVSIQTNVLGDGPWKLLDDIVLAVTAYIPDRFLPELPQSIWRYNTVLCTGSTSATMATIPCDIISLSVYDMGVLGVVVLPLLVGVLVSLIEGHFHGRRMDAYHLTMYYGFVLTFLRFPSYASMNNLVMNLFAYICVYLAAHGIMLLTGKRKAPMRSESCF